MILEKILGKGVGTISTYGFKAKNDSVFHNNCTVIEKEVSRDSTFTDSCLFTEVVAFWTFTLEAAKSIDAISTLAETWQFLTFINVWKQRTKPPYFHSRMKRNETLSTPLKFYQLVAFNCHADFFFFCF